MLPNSLVRSKIKGGDNDSNLRQVDIVRTDLFEKPNDRIRLTVYIPGPSLTAPFASIANYQVNYSQSILDNPEDYYLSIERFQIPIQSIPVFICPMADISTNTTIFTVGLNNKLNGMSNTQSVIWSSPALIFPRTDYRYYSTYNYSDFIRMVNTALLTSFAAISPPGDAECPYYQYDSTLMRIELVAQSKYYITGLSYPTTSSIDISHNYPLQSLINDGIPTMYVGPTFNAPNAFIVSINNNVNNLFTPLDKTATSPPSYLLMAQQYPTLSNWNTLKSIQIVSNSLPIIQQYVPNVNSGIVGSFAILKDFIPLIEQNETARTSLEYSQSGAYQMINLTGRIPIQKMNISIYWTDLFDNQHPLTLGFGQSASILLQFIKKTTFTG